MSKRKQVSFPMSYGHVCFRTRGRGKSKAIRFRYRKRKHYPVFELKEPSVSLEWLKEIFVRIDKTYGWTRMTSVRDWEAIKEILLLAAEKEAKK